MEPIPLKIRGDDMIRLWSALNQQLDGIRRGKDELEPFAFTAKVRWNLAKNAEILERTKKRYEKVVRSIFKEHKIIPGEKMTDANRDAIAAIKDKETDQQELEIDISGLLTIPLAELLNERQESRDGRDVKIKNEIPQSTLTALLPILV